MNKINFKPSATFVKTYTKFKTVKSFLEKAQEYEIYFSTKLKVSQNSNEFFRKYTNFKDHIEYINALEKFMENKSVHNLNLLKLGFLTSDSIPIVSTICYCTYCGKEKKVEAGIKFSPCTCGHSFFRLNKDIKSYIQANEEFLEIFKLKKS
ncbi:hypothetical protein [Fusobacterium varium]|uniref:hypothetical protein n=1 Tax=Fusobacterium varium TaxID=856 RepID=UPI00303FE838